MQHTGALREKKIICVESYSCANFFSTSPSTRTRRVKPNTKCAELLDDVEVSVPALKGEDNRWDHSDGTRQTVNIIH